MKNKIIISIAAIVILISAIIAIIAFNNKVNNGGAKTYNSMEDAEKAAAFSMDYPDRLCGIPVTGFEANSSTIEVRYGNENYIRKTLGVSDSSGDNTKYKETCEQIINGIKVTLKGNDGLVFLAVWNDNNFGFTVSTARGVTADEMTEYIEATR